MDKEIPIEFPKSDNFQDENIKESEIIQEDIENFNKEITFEPAEKKKKV